MKVLIAAITIDAFWRDVQRIVYDASLHIYVSEGECSTTFQDNVSVTLCLLHNAVLVGQDTFAGRTLENPCGHVFFGGDWSCERGC